RQTLADRRVERPCRRRLEHQHRLPTFTQQVQRTQCERGVEVVLQTILMCQTADRGWCGVFGAGLRDQEFATAAVISVAPDSAVETLTVLPQHVERGALSGARQPRVGHLASRRDPSRLDNRVDRYLGTRG